ncbi:hypothetical protein VQ042_03835 [Aurantimonas sp. A2-1-M11]|uniref:N-acyl amino acid synthase FeeM domain-containing protein n=1 Tax=Aurantimonas sp. A2-1-M11 TaxID=3113712 RepID=UPI002F9392CB
MEIVRYFQATSDYDREKIYRLRYDAYLAEGAIGEIKSRMFKDRHDTDVNAFLLGIEIEDRLVASIRLHITTPECRVGPAMDVFNEELSPLLDRGESFVDPTRFVIDDSVRRMTTLLPFAGLRLGSMLADHFDATYMLATVRPEHVPFYDRICLLHPRTPARHYPGLKKPIALCYNAMETLRRELHPKFPVFQSTPGERAELYGPSTSLVGRTRWTGLANDNAAPRFLWRPKPAESAEA